MIVMKVNVGSIFLNNIRRFGTAKRLKQSKKLYEGLFFINRLLAKLRFPIKLGMTSFRHSVLDTESKNEFCKNSNIFLFFNLYHKSKHILSFASVKPKTRSRSPELECLHINPKLIYESPTQSMGMKEKYAKHNITSL